MRIAKYKIKYETYQILSKYGHNQLKDFFLQGKWYGSMIEI